LGRRKSKRIFFFKKKNIEPLFFFFNCPFCNHDLIFFFRNTAKVTCRVCLEDFQTSINFLSEPIDVYNDFFFFCETAN
ncbi:transcription elongation factor 1 homolog, partial [Ceratitis capitata]|uniref:transcription elongation factor 1 homolog n=1 Tax=Ceratitis capitata TaxID=7213 RepID=UPI0003296FF1